MDISRAHVVFVCGKRGSGKSYTLGAIAEGLSDLPEDIKQNISIILLDTMGIFWTMKYPNKKDEELLREWELKSKGLDIKIFTPIEYFEKYKEEGIPTDFSFSINPSDFDGSDWCLSFEISQNEPAGVLIERVVNKLKKEKGKYTIDELIQAVKGDEKSDPHIKDSVENRLLSTKEWGVFSEKATLIKDLAVGGQVTVLDLSCYATMASGWRIKSLVIGLIAKKLFIERMIARKDEEYKSIHETMSYTSDEKKKQEMPLVWLVIDEAHEFLPRDEQTTATIPLVTILREGRQPGISLILASQQPGRIHTDVITQSDTVISHRLTAKMDVEALGALMQSYMEESLTEQLNDLPRVSGAAIVFDDTNERMYPIRVRPRFTWHGGEAPTAIKEEKKVFEF